TIFDFLEKATGVAYPWQNYKQVPVRDFLYAGMENTSVTIFSDAYVTDSTGFADRNYVNVNAHELAHQWFGNLVTAKSGTHHWLQEGFATYYALLAEREIFGDDHYYRKLHESAEQLMALSAQNAGERLLDSTASSLTFYEKGAWALHILREYIGNEAFKNGIKSYITTYRFAVADTGDLIREMEKASGKALDEFVETWLKGKIFPEEEALRSLQKNPFLNRLLQLKKETSEAAVLSVFSEKNYFPLNTEIIVRVKKHAKAHPSFYKKILRSTLPKERQAVALTLDTVPPELKADFESLLTDKSYVTVENALYTLWLNFPADRKNYLDKTRGILGFSDKSTELLWLTLALATPGYGELQKPHYYKTLSGYTSPVYPFQVRQNAFTYLYQLQAWSDGNLKDLVNACLHPTWQFARSSQSLLDTLLKNPDYKRRFQDIFSELSVAEQNYLRKRTEL
ncbi:MAG: M1 family peptidase, partial [Sinomicrobium sp.]|nr:M1 family peptidase [Sinomicrobium sp.]